MITLLDEFLIRLILYPIGFCFVALLASVAWAFTRDMIKGSKLR